MLDALAQGVDAQLLWAVDSRGDVSVDVSSVSDSGAFVLIVYCNARFEWARDLDGQQLPFEVGGSEAACADDADPLGEEVPAFQSYAVEGSRWIFAHPIVEWTSAGGGTRVARTPSVRGIGLSSPASTIAGHYPVGFGSTFRTGVSGAENEQFDYFSPAALSEGTVNLTPGQLIGEVRGLHEQLNIEWSIDSSTLNIGDGGGTYELPSGLARWSDPAAQRAAEFSTLFAGVLLGIVAALLVEGLLAALKRGWRLTTRPRPEATTSSPPQGQRTPPRSSTPKARATPPKK